MARAGTQTTCDTIPEARRLGLLRCLWALGQAPSEHPAAPARPIFPCMQPCSSTRLDTNVGTTMSKTITASRYQMAGQDGTITSICVFVAFPVSASPNNQFQVAVYADNNGAPGALIASSAPQSIVPDTWNTVPINATVSASTYYWLAYNSNGSDGNSNNLRYDSGGLEAWITPESFGTWPCTFGTPSGTEAVDLSIYADFQ